jgi:hypothetical protein
VELEQFRARTESILADKHHRIRKHTDSTVVLQRFFLARSAGIDGWEMKRYATGFPI